MPTHTASTFWGTIPRKSILGFMLGVFFIFSAIGFANDAMQMGQQPMPRFLLGVFLSGGFAMCYAASGLILRGRFWKVFLPLFAAQFMLMGYLGKIFPDLPHPASMDAAGLAALSQRLILDGVAISTAIGLGYACFVYVSISEGRRYARVHAEMVLAAEIHRVLVPAIDESIGPAQFYGRTVPATEVGGDLIDVFRQEGNWIAYVADVSGHGVAPGVLMGMVKSAARMQLSSPEKSAALLERLNAVLYPIKKSAMFITFAYLAWDGERVEFAMAGHPPILHHHAATGEITELACSNLPLGMFAGRQFESGVVACQEGDLFLLFTDGVPEVVNADDEEFGLGALKALIAAHAAKPLDAIFQAVVDATNRHGHPDDDRSLLLVRWRRERDSNPR